MANQPTPRGGGNSPKGTFVVLMSALMVLAASFGCGPDTTQLPDPIRVAEVQCGSDLDCLSGSCDQGFGRCVCNDDTDCPGGTCVDGLCVDGSGGESCPECEDCEECPSCPDCPSLDCQDTGCPSGMTCDPGTGQCYYPNQPPQGCVETGCPSGMSCDSATGQCYWPAPPPPPDSGCAIERWTLPDGSQAIAFDGLTVNGVTFGCVFTNCDLYTVVPVNFEADGTRWVTIPAGNFDVAYPRTGDVDDPANMGWGDAVGCGGSLGWLSYGEAVSGGYGAEVVAACGGDVGGLGGCVPLW